MRQVPSTETRSRLESLQWRIEMERNLAKTPLDSATKIHEMMWASLERNYRHLQQLASMIDPNVETLDSPEPQKAKVLPFRNIEDEITI